MRTTLDIDDDVLLAAKEIGQREKKTASVIISELARRALAATPGPGKAKAARHGFRAFGKRGGIVTNEQVDRLRNESGV